MNLFNQIFAFFFYLFFHSHNSLINFALLSSNQRSQIQMSTGQGDHTEERKGSRMSGPGAEATDSRPGNLVHTHERFACFAF